ncbi:MAG: 2-oxoglutarate and iron-dependent oxygenase domain-containing protein [Actinomycetota bacterium]
MTSTGATPTIPLVDLEPWFTGSDDDRLELARQVDEHLQRCGFLVVTNHRLPQEVLDDCRSAARTFFHQPDDVKAAVAMDGPFYRGWIGNELESNAATYGVDTPPDLKETYAYGPVDVDDTARDALRDRYAPNVWPDAFPDVASSFGAFWRAARALNDELLDLLSLALGLDRTHLRDLSTAPTSIATINWYGPRGANEPLPDQFRVGPHTDFGTITVLDRESGLGGLQVQDENGAWVDAPDGPGGLTINTGDLLRRWTNDRWCSNVHRVLPPPSEEPTEELISLVYFGEPNPDALVETFPSCITADRPAQYDAILACDYLDQKMAELVVD